MKGCYLTLTWLSAGSYAYWLTSLIRLLDPHEQGSNLLLLHWKVHPSACYSDYLIIPVAVSNGHFFFSLLITYVFHCRSAVALFQPAICFISLHIPGFSGKNHLCLGHAVFREKRRSKRSAGSGDASKSFCLDMVCIMPALFPLARAWPMAKPKGASRKYSKLYGTRWTCNLLTEIWVGVSDRQQ